jgi:phage gp36-like protein
LLPAAAYAADAIAAAAAAITAALSHRFWRPLPLTPQRLPLHAAQVGADFHQTHTQCLKNEQSGAA